MRPQGEFVPTSVASERNGTAESSISAPEITLPRGGGAIRGIGEKFAANPVTGTGSMSVPIALSPGRSGFGPQLSLRYDSGSGNGPFGYGWSLSLPSITRKTDKGVPQYCERAEPDIFILSDAEDLVPVLEADGTPFEDRTTAPGQVIHRYRPRIEALFARIERWTDLASGQTHWRTISRDNITTLYGKDDTSRIADPADPAPPGPKRTFSWLPCESYDDKGNALVYVYTGEDAENVDLRQSNERNRDRTAQRYLKRILYGNRVSRLVDPDLSDASWLFEAVLDYDEGHYEELALSPAVKPDDQHQLILASPTAGQPWTSRPDPFSTYRAGFEVRSYRRCRRILMFHRIPKLDSGEAGYDGLVRSIAFDYGDLALDQPVTIEDELAHHGSTRFGSFLCAITQSGYAPAGRPPVTRNGVQYATYIRKPLPPLEFEYSKATIADEVRELDKDSYENLPAGVDNSLWQLVDLDGEGVSGILTEQSGAWYYKPNLGDGRFGALETIAARPALSALDGNHQLLDLAGDGQLDLVAFDGPAPGFYERTADADWLPFRPFRAIPNLGWSDPNLRFIDLNGDGHADVLISEDDAFTWHESLSEEGFGPARRAPQPRNEEQGPHLLFADGTQSVFLADMSGDGLTDLVRIRNHDVCYWPNLGYGRFGAKVAMDNPPWFDCVDRFDQLRIRLADIDGSGTVDIIYLHPEGARLYFNQAGNRLSDARRLAPFPQAGDMANVTTADLLGNGTACLVWSSPLPADARRPLRYIDLMGGTKPHLLVRAVNNLGAETDVEYVPSTRFYLADKRGGRPWVTRLPFPVHVVERVVTRDHVSRNRFVTRYAYHHGYFDGVEREFRGFGLVEQWDSEAIGALGDLPPDGPVDPASHVPPVHTKSWYHTGVYLGREHVSEFFAGLLDARDTGEYYREPGLTDSQARDLLLDDTVLPEGLTVDVVREACRALKGSLLRQEIYGLDGTTAEQHPYLVTEQNFTVQRLQSRGANRSSVFFTCPRETISYHYERDPTKPRIGHSLTLEVDEFGNVLRSAAIAYGRQAPDPDLSPNDQLLQGRTFVTCAESRFTEMVEETDSHRAPLPCEARTYELTGLSLIPGARRFSFDAVLGAATSAIAIPYEKVPGASGKHKRLIEHVRTYYRRDDLTGRLPLGKLESLALPSESFKLALSAGLVSAAYGSRADAAMIGAEARYVNSEGDSDWWIPSGQMSFSPGAADNAAQERFYAREHFFLPQRYRDPFHSAAASTESFVRYDGHDLLVLETRDPLDNRVTAGERDVDPDKPLVRCSLDYRVLQPAEIMDPNRNRSVASFDALGMVAGIAAMGKPEDLPQVGDRLAATFQADLTQGQISRFLANPKGPLAEELLDQASTRTVYDLTAYWREPDPAKKAPAVAALLAREVHVSDLAAGSLSSIHVSLSYSDGFGREIQKKVQAEPGPVPERNPDGTIVVGGDGQPAMTASAVAPRWVGSGWTVFNNKGAPIRQFEPFFTDKHHFEFNVRVGVSPILFYDPVGRVVATLHPDHSWQKTVFDPWRQAQWDVNDTILVANPATDPEVGDHFGRLADSGAYLPSWHDLRTDPMNAAQAALRWPDPQARDAEKRAALEAAVHAATPTVTQLDALGRPFLTVAHNRLRFSDMPAGAPALVSFHRVRTLLDIEGNERAVIDAADRIVMRSDYDMLGGRIRQDSMEAGTRWTLDDVAGKPLYGWDSRDHRFRSAYDRLRRPTRSFLTEGAGAERTIGRIAYGEDEPTPEAANLRGRIVRQDDQAGVALNDMYDFKGNLVRSRRRLASVHDTVLDWSVAVPLASETFARATRYDALNRPVQLVAPHSDQPGTPINVVRPVYNEAGLLDSVHAWLGQAAEPTTLLATATADFHPVTNIDYDAKAQRTLIGYGNGASTRYTHDRWTYRLTNLATQRGTDTFQDLHYCYDPAGNVAAIRDDAQQTLYFKNKKVEPSAEFRYDALYRLIEATGREHLGQIGGAPIPHCYDDARRTRLPHPGDGQAMGRYLERYVYDAVGNFEKMKHVGTDPTQPGWTRAFVCAEASQIEPGRYNNRLTSTSMGSLGAEAFSVGGDGYDAHGNLLRMPQLEEMIWDFEDRLRMTRRQKVNADDTDGALHHGERTWYVYDAAGERVRKVTEGADGTVKDERIYLGGFEIYRRHGASPLVRETLHITDDKQRIALIETRTSGSEPGVSPQLVRYQFGNLLGSACLELDDQARIISYEEYTPYGSTSYQAASDVTQTPKRYRFTGKERDEESGLYYHGARYYAPWLGRWVSCDPSLSDGPNRYAFTQLNPVTFRDSNGEETSSPDQTTAWDKAKVAAGVAWSLLELKATQMAPKNFFVFGPARQGFVANTFPVPIPPPTDPQDRKEWERGEQTAAVVAGAEMLASGVPMGPGPGGPPRQLAGAGPHGPAVRVAERPAAFPHLAAASGQEPKKAQAEPTAERSAGASAAAAPEPEGDPQRKFTPAPKPSNAWTPDPRTTKTSNAQIEADRQRFFDQGGKKEVITKSTQEHHVASDKDPEYKSLFEELFERAGLSLQDRRNLISIEGHGGKHGKEYNKLVYDRLSKAVEGKNDSQSYREALLGELKLLKQDLKKNDSTIGRMVRTK